MTSNYLTPFVFLILLSSCELKTDSRLNADRINRRMDSFKIKRVTDDQIVATAYGKGAEVAQRLIGKISTDSLCQYGELKERVPAFAELVKSAQVRCGAEETIHPKERELWEAYQAAFASQKDNLTSTIQRLGGKSNYEELVYTQPLNRSDTLAMLSIVMEKKEVIKVFQPEK